MGNDRHFSFKKAQIENFLKAEYEEIKNAASD